jgi:type II secretory pathway pseudopilin PulG
MIRRGRWDGEDGVSLVELLVVMMLLTVIGGVITAGVASASRATQRAQHRVQAHAEVQRAVERISREVRAADPVVVALADHLEVRVERDGATRTYVARVVGTELRDGMDGAQIPVVRDVATATPIFRYYDSEGIELSPVTDVSMVARVTISVARNVFGQPPILVETSVALRNIES